jgi:hypothetical protein
MEVPCLRLGAGLDVDRRRNERGCVRDGKAGEETGEKTEVIVGCVRLSVRANSCADVGGSSSGTRCVEGYMRVVSCERISMNPVARRPCMCLMHLRAEASWGVSGVRLWLCISVWS